MIVVIAGYTGFESRNWFLGPVLTITSPKNGDTLNLPLIEVQGETRNTSLITLNDRAITIDDQGVFKEKILLSPGYNVIKINAKDKFGRVKEKVLELVLKDTNELVRR